jgi:hypothetical protein
MCTLHSSDQRVWILSSKGDFFDLSVCTTHHSFGGGGGGGGVDEEITQATIHPPENQTFDFNF